MHRKIIGVTVGTPINPVKMEEIIKPVKTVNGVEPDENGNVKVTAEEPLIGLSSEITPSQVAEAVKAGRDVVITHVDLTYGAFTFNAFMHTEGFRYVIASDIVYFQGSYMLVELGGFTATDTWTMCSTQLATTDGIPALPVIKTTAEITPTEVKALMDEGKPFAVTHTDSTYGSMLFNSFVYSHAANNSILSSTIFELAGIKFCAQLMGKIPTDAWEFKAIQLAGKDDIPTALPNPNALTINGQSYDGSETVSIDTREFVIAVTGDEENGYTTDKPYDEIMAAYEARRTLVCEYEGTRHPFLTINEGMFQFAVSLGGVAAQFIFIANGAAMVGQMFGSLTINNEMWDGTEPKDFTETINGMIDAKLAEIPNASGVSF